MEGENKLITKTFLWMFLGLLGTAIVAWYTYSSGLVVNLIISDWWRILLILELVVVIVFSLLFRKFSPTVVAILYFVYSMINGVTMSTIFVIFDLGSIIWLFVCSAALFGILALIGAKTQKDVSSWHTILFVGLGIGILLSIVNLILKNSMFDLILDWIILAIFCGVTIYDMNTIKGLVEYEGLDPEKLHIYGAMELYLDFINIFLRVLSIFGKRRN